MKQNEINIGTRIGYFNGKTCKYVWAICEGKEDGKLYMRGKVGKVDNPFIDDEEIVLKLSKQVNPNILPSHPKYPFYSISIKY